MRLSASPLVLAFLLLALGSIAAPAEASMTSREAGVLRVQADPGESNVIEVTREDGSVVVRDGTARAAGAGCRVRSAGVIACGADGLRAIDVRAGDRDDSVRIADALPATVVGGAGADRLSGGSGIDRIDGSGGDDVLEGGAGADELRGGTGVDLLAGGSGADLLRGETGDDDLHGEDGDDIVLAGSGDDLLDGGEGADRLLGDQGADTLRGGAGLDRLEGAQGADEVFADDGEVDSIECGDGADSAQVDPQDDVAGCEKLRGPAGAAIQSVPAPAPAPVVLTPLTPFPVVRIVGAVSGSRTRLSRVIVTAPKGARVESRCSGPGCPYRRRVTTLPLAGGRVALRGLQRRLRAGVIVEVFVTQEGRVGKYARFRLRRGRAPQRTDMCVPARSMRAVACAS